MSYILDALKKAEAERQHGAVPNIHVHPLPAYAGQTGKRPAKRSIALLFAAVALISAFLLSWYRPWRDMADAPSQPALKMSSAMQPAPRMAPANPPVARTPATIVAIAPAPEDKPAPAEHAVEKKKPAPTTHKIDEATIAKATPATSAATKSPAPDVTESLASLPRDLPAHLRSEVPAVTIGGYIYSDTPSERQLLVNKRLLREGEDVAPGLKLEKMLPKAAVFNYKGYRYQVAY
jgi:general secretion pathway protein B